MIILMVLLLVTVKASPSLIQKQNLKIAKGQVIDIKSPGYPDVAQTGTKVTWFLTGDIDTNLLLTCEDVRISPTPNCENGYFMVNDGEKGEKYCGAEHDLIIKSVSSTMKLEFDLTWAAGVVKCQVKAVEEEKQNLGDLSEEEIELEANGPSYDKIYFNQLPANIHLKWRFTTRPSNKISVYCTMINLAECELKRDYLIADDTVKVETICGNHYNKRVILSAANKLTLELRIGKSGAYRLDCLAQAVTGNKPFQYLNTVSEEIDSSEYGIRAGPKKTNCDCGWSAKSPARIVNGEEVSDGQYPWMVSVNHRGGHFCGGSILTEYHVLTAAHCTSSRVAKDFRVFIGTTNNTHAVRGQIIQVKKIIEADYKGDYNVNDIAMLVLKEKIHFTRRIGPVCLTPARLSLDHKYVTVMGWGNLGKEGEWRYPQQLMRAHIRVVDFTTCSFLWYRKFDASGPDRLCTWASNRDSCFGDSGGPVVWLDPEINRYTLLGIVSMGRGCNTAIPKINANVPYHYDWIQKTITESMPGMMTCRKM
uniref:Venom S1 protease with CUB domain 9 n=1 Tax=Platymeris rhadamanthus TaxID=1134088 RepID=A0A6B9KZI3_PLARH|nr:venom S1 protease with CUB domain 9 [Platymeris rhadamanthus]